MQVVQKGDKEVVQAEGELDLSHAAALRAALDKAADEGKDDVVLDLTGSTYIDSAILQELIRSHNVLSKQDRGFIILARPDTQPYQVIHTVMFHTIMKVRGSWEEI